MNKKTPLMDDMTQAPKKGKQGWDRDSLPPTFPHSAMIASEAEKWITLLLQHFLI